MEDKFEKLKALVFSLYETYENKRHSACEDCICFEGHKDRDIHMIQFGGLSGKLNVLNDITDDLEEILEKIKTLT